MCLDEVIDFVEEFWFVIIAVVVAVAGIGVAIHYDLIDPNDLIPHQEVPGVKITINTINDDGIESVDGAGKYKMGSEVELSVSVYTGWFFAGWYDKNGNKLSDEYEYTFRPTESCTIYAKTTRGYGVNVYKTEGIQSAQWTYTYQLDETAYVKAVVRDGYTFSGWYDIEGNLVSSTLHCSLPEKHDYTLIAKTTADSKYLGDNQLNFASRTKFVSDSTYMVLFNQSTGDYVASNEGNGEWNVSVAPGLYKLKVFGNNTSGRYSSESKSILVEGDIANTYYWTYNDTEYSLTWNLNTEDYKYYRNLTNNRSPNSDSARLNFFTYDSANIQQIASKLNSLSTGMSENERADFVLKFVQLCTDYQYDSDYIGKSDYWKYPLETLFEARGDCEDTTILYCTLMKSMGYDSAMLLYIGSEYIGKGHAAASVALTDLPGGTYYNYGGKHYYYCETTSTTNVGDIWDQYNKARILVVQ